jgi:hypothetical protein
MPRTKKGTPPTYRQHSSGQAVVTVRDQAGRRRDILLGPWNTLHSHEEYRRILKPARRSPRRLSHPEWKNPSPSAKAIYAVWRLLNEDGKREFVQLSGWQEQVNELTAREQELEDAMGELLSIARDGMKQSESYVRTLVEKIQMKRTRRRPTAERNAQWEQWRSEGKIPKVIQQLWKERTGEKVTLDCIKQALKRTKRTKKNK